MRAALGAALILAGSLVVHHLRSQTARVAIDSEAKNLRRNASRQPGGETIPAASNPSANSADAEDSKADGSESPQPAIEPPAAAIPVGRDSDLDAYNRRHALAVEKVERR